MSSSAAAASIELPDAPATARIGAALAAHLQGGDTIALVGDLGAGKTTFVIGLVDALGGGTATSPTFSLVNEYPGGRLVVWHIDLYRIEKEAELVELGLDEIVGNPRGVALIEWADKYPDVLPRDYLRIELIHEVEDSRRLIATGTGSRGQSLIAAMNQSLNSGRT